MTVSFAEKTTCLKEEVDGELLRSMREGVPQDLTGVPKRTAQENDAIPKVAPKWLKHDRQVSWDSSGLDWLQGSSGPSFQFIYYTSQSELALMHFRFEFDNWL